MKNLYRWQEIKFKIKELGSSISYIKVLSNDLTAIGYDNSYVEIFDFNKINSITKFQAHYSDNDNYDIMYINELKNKRLITAFADNLIKILKNHNNQFSLDKTLYGHSDFCSKVIELKYGDLTSCSFDLTIRIWEIKQYYKCIKTIQAHSYWINEIYELPNTILISIGGEFDPSLKFWNVYQS